MKNPLLKTSQLKNKAIEFNLIKTEHFMPALQAAIKAAKSNIEKIKEDTSPVTFENTFEALETSSDDVGVVAGVFYNLLSAETNDDLQNLALEFGPILSEFQNDITLDEKLFARLKEAYDQKLNFNLNTEQKMVLENTYSGFTRNGALLDEKGKEKLREIDQELSTLSPKFSENVLKATNEFKLVIDNKDDLAGLPESAIEAAAMEAKQQDLSEEHWVFNLQAPSYVPFMRYCSNRELRYKMWIAFTSRAFKGEFDNQLHVLRIVKLRHERAKLLGFDNHAQFVLEKRMAETPEKVTEFLNTLLEKSMPAAKKEIATLKEFAKSQDGLDEIMPWDVPYYIEKYKKEKFDFDAESLRPYFKLENVIDGVFEHAKRLYGLKFIKSDEYPKYHPDVTVYEVYKHDTDEYIGLFYTDFFPRATKKSGAWMTNFHEQGLFKGEVIRPHVAIVCNFTKSTETKPSLLTFNEVQTLFHEFGHSLHSLLSHCHYSSISGTNVYWDFVELPSQIFENWTLEKEGLSLFAKHYETGELLPDESIQKLKDTSKFMAGWASTRQLNFAMLDMYWHYNDPTNFNDVADVEEIALKPSLVLPKEEESNMSCSFSHIFAGGYSAGYYSYKWAEVLDADAFELFKEKGVFNPEVAKSFYDNILSKGGSEHPMSLYKKFRGREPDPNALLRREGLA